MARWPAPGRCKSRLAVGVGIQRAACIQSRLNHHLAAVIAAAAARLEIEPVLAVSGLAPRAACRWGEVLGLERVVLQGRGSLGLRLQRQVQRSLREGAEQVILIGSDLPDLDPQDLITAFGALQRSPLVLGPASDGGYWLLGLRRSCPSLFCGITWGSDRVLAQTLEAARSAGLAVEPLGERSDLDRPADLLRWR